LKFRERLVVSALPFAGVLLTPLFPGAFHFSPGNPKAQPDKLDLA